MKRHFNPHRPHPQMALSLPAVPKEYPLRHAFRRAELARVGMDFKAVLEHPRGASLLRDLAAAYRRCDDHAARLFKGHLIRIRSTFNAR